MSPAPTPAAPSTGPGAPRTTATTPGPGIPPPPGIGTRTPTARPPASPAAPTATVTAKHTPTRPTPPAKPSPTPKPNRSGPTTTWYTSSAATDAARRMSASGTVGDRACTLAAVGRPDPALVPHESRIGIGQHGRYWCLVW
ncbi:hypothetical protein SALBM217S_01962 [Streptomyces griseoloalbus]